MTPGARLKTHTVLWAGPLGVLAVIGALQTYGVVVENPATQFRDYAEWQAAPADQRGWIPRWLPREARDIREVHNVDTDEWWLAFQLRGVRLDTVGAIRIVTPSDGPPWWAWMNWPAELSGTTFGIRRARMWVIGDPHGARCFAQNHNTWYVYSWGCDWATGSRRARHRTR